MRQSSAAAVLVSLAPLYIITVTQCRQLASLFDKREEMAVGRFCCEIIIFHATASFRNDWIVVTVTSDLEPCQYFDPTPPVLEISTYHTTKRCEGGLISFS